MLKYLNNVVTLELNIEACNGCGMCITVCPRAVFALKDRQAAIADRDACIECGACAINCPTSAIRVQTGAGCAAGVLLSAIGIDSCCGSGSSCAPPAATATDQLCCSGSADGNARVDNKMPERVSVTARQKEIGMTKSFVIYEAAMCCSSGVCGPNPDKSLIDVQDALDKLKDMGAKIERYSITGNPKKFRENPEVIKLMQERQIKALPITMCDGKVVKVGSYPSMDELWKCFADDNKGLPVAEEEISSGACCSGQEITGTEGCCAGQNACDISCGPNYKDGIRLNIKGKCC